MKAKYFYEKINKEKIRLMRVYSETGDVLIPGEIDGYVVEEIGEYCFAPNNKFLNDHPFEIAYEGETTKNDYLLEMDQNAVLKVYLPDSIKKIGNNAFYNCKRLEYISIGEGLEEIGSDAFMNCIRLERISLKKDITAANCLKQLLAQITWNVEIEYFSKDNDRGVFFFPEYYEAYDEIGPAHIFELNLSGEGFRTRQCFVDKAFVIAEYDAVFPKALAEEPENNLFQMACNRICFPIALETESKELYRGYVYEHQKLIEKQIINNESYELKEKIYRLEGLIKEMCIDNSHMEQFIAITSQKGYGELTVQLQKWKRAYFRKVTKSYDFDDF